MIDVLIISSLSQRYYYDAFVQECDSVGIRVGILDPDEFIEKHHLIDLSFDSTGLRGSIEVVKLGQDHNTTVMADISVIKVAWYLRVDRKFRISEIEETAERFKCSESLWALESLFSGLPCPWINTFQAIDRINCNKLIQQINAEKNDIRTPKTVLSNSSKKVIEFCSDNGGELLFKTIGYTKLDPEGKTAIYSEVFNEDELRRNESAIRVCPVYAQEYIPKLYEYRVMVIGEEVLACRIDSQSSEKTLIDWRHYDFANVSHTKFDLSEKLKLNLINFMHSVDLNYGAIDMIETPDGEFVFLEVNPSGQWDWISKLAGLPIAESVARMLKSYVL